MVYPKKQTGKSPGYYPYTDEQIKMAGWCLNNGIAIAVSPDWQGSALDWIIEITIKGNTHVDPTKYKQKEVLPKMYEYYKYYYDKYNKQ
jgi:hypothetical protein|tara:strand:+ start:276 stop:542 length:267 start_codon:yes stop_codon:yes gene_type:complete